MAVNVYRKPKTYRGRVHWYAAYWRTNTCHLFTSKAAAVKFTRENPDDGIVNVDWFDWKAEPRYAISRTMKFVDHRKAA
jgi:hypothetical protein